MKKQVLLPCPFCGSKPNLYTSYDGFYIVQCTDCGCGTLTKHDANTVMKDWNRRVQPPIVKELSERLEKAENIASDLCDDFTDFVTSGVHNAAPYCANKRPECVNSHGWCSGDNRVCKGFLPRAAVMEEGTKDE